MVPGRISTVSIIYWELHSRKAHFYHILPHSALPVVHTHTTHSPKVALTCLKGYERVATLFEALFFDSYIFGIKSSTKIWTLFTFPHSELREITFSVKSMHNSMYFNLVLWFTFNEVYYGHLWTLNQAFFCCLKLILIGSKCQNCYFADNLCHALDLVVAFSV